MSLNLDALEKLTPTRSEFFLSTIDKTIYLSPCTLGKILELHRKYGDLEALLKNNISNVPKVAFDLMAPESRMLFKVTEVETTDDDGNVVMEKIGGFKLFEMSIAGYAEIKKMIFAINKSLGGDDDGVKKKIEQIEQEGMSPP